MIRKKYSPEMQQLEGRLVPAVSINLVGGQLTILGDNGDNAVDVRTIDNLGNVQVRIDGLTRLFAPGQITSTVISTGAGNDDVFTNVGVGTFVDSGRGNDAVNILHGAGAQVLGGAGRDRLYAIIGGPNLLDGGAGRDQIYTNTQGVITADPADENPVIFGQAVRPGFTLINGVIYFVPGAGDNQVLLQQVGNQILAISQVNGQAFDTQLFNRSDVTDFAVIFGSGNDTLVNTVEGLDLTAYGAGGNDTLIAGNARQVLFKGGGGNDTLDGSDARFADVTGDGGADVLLGDVVRTDGLDLVFVKPNGRLIRAA